MKKEQWLTKSVREVGILPEDELCWYDESVLTFTCLFVCMYDYHIAITPLAPSES